VSPSKGAAGGGQQSAQHLRDNEKEIDRIISNTLQLQEPKLPTALKGGGSGRVCACMFGEWRLP